MDRRLAVGISSLAIVGTLLTVRAMTTGGLRRGLADDYRVEALLYAMDELGARAEIEETLGRVPESRRSRFADSLAAVGVFAVADSVLVAYVAVLEAVFRDTPVPICAQWGRGVADPGALNALYGLDSTEVLSWARARVSMLFRGLRGRIAVPLPTELEIVEMDRLLTAAVPTNERPRFVAQRDHLVQAEDADACWYWRTYLRGMGSLPIGDAAAVFRTHTARSLWSSAPE